MAAISDAEYTTLDLRQMGREEAMDTLTGRQFERWKSLHESVANAEENREAFREAEHDTHDILFNADASDIAAEIELFGNDVLVYYGPEDPRLREAVSGLMDSAGVDPDDADSLSADDIDDDMIDDAKDTLVDILDIALVEWNGHAWDELDDHVRSDILARVATPRPDGWGVAGLMDAVVQTITAVEERRDSRMETIRKFRDETRRGNR